MLIAGVAVAGYNGTYTILSVPSTTTFTYYDPTAAMAGSAGTVTAGPVAAGGSTFTIAGLVRNAGATVNFIGGANNLTPLGLSATDTVQTITFGGIVSGGTFTLQLTNAAGSQTTGNITYSTTPSVLQANIQFALAALSNVGSASNVSAVANAAANVVTVTFQNALGATTIPTMIATIPGLPGRPHAHRPTDGHRAECAEPRAHQQPVVEPDPDDGAPVRRQSGQYLAVRGSEQQRRRGAVGTGDFASYGPGGITPFTNYLLENVLTATANLPATIGPLDIVKLVAGFGGVTPTIITATANRRSAPCYS